MLWVSIKTTVPDYGLNRRAAMVVVISTYQPYPNLRQFVMYYPLLKYVATYSVYIGEVFKTPNIYIYFYI